MFQTRRAFPYEAGIRGPPVTTAAVAGHVPRPVGSGRRRRSEKNRAARVVRQARFGVLALIDVLKDSPHKGDTLMSRTRRR
jgi:hypothetical protein